MKASKMEYYDSHEQIKALVESGIKTKQAEAIVKTLQITRSIDLSNLATKDQLNLLEERLNAKIDKLDAKIDRVAGELNAKIDKVASDVVVKMLFWIVPMFVAIMVAVLLR